MARYKSSKNKTMQQEFSAKKSQYRWWRPLKGPGELHMHRK